MSVALLIAATRSGHFSPAMDLQLLPVRQEVGGSPTESPQPHLSGVAVCLKEGRVLKILKQEFETSDSA